MGFINRFELILALLESTVLNQSELLSEPVILAEIAPNSFNLIDGRHRMEKARRMGIEKIKAYKVHAIYLPDFIVIKKGYLAFVDYWNYRLKSYNKKLIRTDKK